jgi:hypothetical protein
MVSTQQGLDRPASHGMLGGRFGGRGHPPYPFPPGRASPGVRVPSGATNPSCRGVPIARRAHREAVPITDAVPVCGPMPVRRTRPGGNGWASPIAQSFLSIPAPGDRQ